MLTWSGVIAMEGVPTGDGRLIAEGALTWLDGPMPLRFVEEDEGGHDGAVVVGAILTVERQDGGVIYATGVIDESLEYGAHAAHLIRNELANGVSIDPDDVTIEYQGAEGEEPDEDAPMGSMTTVLTSARIRAATLVAIPAFAEAKIMLDEGQDVPAEDPEDPEDEPVDESVDEPVDGEPMAAQDAADPVEKSDSVMSSWLSIVASAPVAPPAEWFRDPGFSGPTKVRVEDDRIFGHLATWGTCHIGFGEGRCVQPPVSHAKYAYFATGTILADDGTEFAVGTITMDGPHADKRLSGRAAAAHYDVTCFGVADVAVGEDEFGIWISGAMRPGVSDEAKRVLRASSLSGDWRKLGGELELVAALAVNVPGFPIVETHLAASGCPDSLIATGLVFGETAEKPAPSKGVVAAADALAARIGRDKASRKAELVERVKG